MLGGAEIVEMPFFALVSIRPVFIHLANMMTLVVNVHKGGNHGFCEVPFSGLMVVDIKSPDPLPKLKASAGVL